MTKVGAEFGVASHCLPTLAPRSDVYPHLFLQTFTRWCNNYLTQRSLAINDLQVDLSDGTLLHNLLEILGNEEVLPKTNKKAKLKLQKIENLNTCLKYVKAKNIKLVGIGAEGPGTLLI